MKNEGNLRTSGEMGEKEAEEKASGRLKGKRERPEKKGKRLREETARERELGAVVARR